MLETAGLIQATQIVAPPFVFEEREALQQCEISKASPSEFDVLCKPHHRSFSHLPREHKTSPMPAGECRYQESSLYLYLGLSVYVPALEILSVRRELTFVWFVKTDTNMVPGYVGDVVVPELTRYTGLERDCIVGRVYLWR